MFENMQYASNGKITSFIQALRASGGLPGAILVAVLLTIGLLHPVFASGLALLMKILFGFSLLGSIF